VIQQQQNTLIAQWKAQNDILQKKLAYIEPKARKPFQRDPNTAFADYELIEKARQEAEKAVANSNRPYERKIAQEALQIAQTTKEDMFIEWQLDNYN
jgi:hypothetical protein